VRDLWTLHGIESNCTAAIWRNDFGSCASSTEASSSSRACHVLATRRCSLSADQLKANLMEDGWFEVPNATGAG
jgi:hypothetical protein